VGRDSLVTAPTPRATVGRTLPFKGQRGQDKGKMGEGKTDRGSGRGSASLKVLAASVWEVGRKEAGPRFPFPSSHRDPNLEQVVCA
jgi:hypothetical protein